MPSEPQSHRRIAVIGAGPYGLAVAARLHAAHADFILLGRPMSFWREHVPIGTRLLTDLPSCSFARAGSLDPVSYEKKLGLALGRPLRADEFTDYGLWFQRTACPEPDERTVVQLSRRASGFAIQLEGGGVLTADRVVLAIGLRTFANRPREFAGLSRELVMHTSDLHDIGAFRGRRMAIIGRGQSALDCAALLTEAGASVEVLARTGAANWLAGASRNPVPAPLSELDPSTRLRVALAEFLRKPNIFRRLPARFRAYWLEHFLRPKPSLDLVPRLERVRLTSGRAVASARAHGNELELRLDDGATRIVDHVVLGTGYTIDVDAIEWLDPGLRKAIQRHDGYPELNRCMESTVPGLHFAGASAAWNFGPLMWFVRGAPWAAECLSENLLRR